MWKVSISGDKQELYYLQRRLAEDQIKITENTEGFWLWSKDFHDNDEFQDIRQKSEELVEALNSWGRLHFINHKKIKLSSLSEVKESETRLYVFPEPGELEFSCSGWAILKREENTLTLDCLKKTLEIAKNDESLSFILEVIENKFPDNWRTLGLIYDTIVGDTALCAVMRDSNNNE